MELSAFQRWGLAVFGIAAVVSACILTTDLKPPKPKDLPPIVSSEKLPDYFPDALKVILKHEGGYVDDKDDKGGATKFGISLRLLKDIKYDVDGDGDSDKDDIIKLNHTDADKIYLKHFWLSNHYNLLSDSKLAIKIMDMSVNMGPSRSHKIVEASINEIVDEQIEVDGIIDDYIIEILNLIEPDILLKEIRKEQAQFYLDLIKRNPVYAKYKTGWLKRATY